MIQDINYNPHLTHNLNWLAPKHLTRMSALRFCNAIIVLRRNQIFAINFFLAKPFLINQHPVEIIGIIFLCVSYLFD